MSDKYYILIGQTPVPCGVMEWADWFETPDNRRVAFTRVLDTCNVSTVFLGIDHRWMGDGPPILFESMAFWPDGCGDEMDRCCTRAQAEVMHQRMVADVTDKIRQRGASTEPADGADATAGSNESSGHS